ncbi:hypothetical protein VWV82_003938 [Cronobacter malonaticus]|uniref:hypothetical protein n=1 Tax=Cronobacter malonaticus TaxID=413503 RepID=UPI00051945F8|nr:hypothetical protein [Cronobacter malonaticus]EMD9275295.1 hypothetical protein [Cronobacter malonaticus]
MNLITTLGLSLTPLLLSTQAQASSVAVPITTVQPLSNSAPYRNRGMSPDAALRLKGDVSARLKQLFTIREKLENAIARIQVALDSGNPVQIPPALVKAAVSAISTGEVTVEIAEESFSRILSAERVACRPALEALKDETINGLVATIETMKKIPELSKQAESREAAVVAFDKERMSLAVNSDKIEMKPGMSREEKRRFILSHAS